MKKKNTAMIIFTLTSLLVCACSPTVQTVEVTRVVPQTQVVTQLVTQVVQITTTPIPTETSVPKIATPIPTDTAEPNHAIDMSEQDGQTVVVQYYTLLGLHLFKEAYQLFSTGFSSPSNEDSFLISAPHFYKVLKLYKVIPAIEHLKSEPYITPQSIGKNWYYAEFYAEGENGMVGAQANGINETYVLVIRENGEWKIDYMADFPSK